MLKFTSIVEYTLCGPTYIESFLTKFGQCINVLNYNAGYPQSSHFARFSITVRRYSFIHLGRETMRRHGGAISLTTAIVLFTDRNSSKPVGTTAY